ncbi:MAG: LPS export ABC transporter periplasmic protein LptC [Bacteroides sp.]|nr:LPS export ABC transporter periplasmic protein LptC [Bacteroides sp.]
MMRFSRILLLLLFALLLVGTGCKEERKVDVAAGLNPDKMATMTTKNISTLISDSGVIQYKIVAPLWKVYDQIDTPYWIFPEGLYLQKYDRAFNVISTVAADSARYFKDRKLWKLMGRVELTKAPKDLFQSAELFWDQKSNKIYSDSFIHIETATHVLEGIGFISNDKLTEYRVVKPMGIFPVNKDDLKEPPAASSPQSGGEDPQATVTVTPVATDTVEL